LESPASSSGLCDRRVKGFQTEQPQNVSPHKKIANELAQEDRIAG
jgi:hypothetical protein